VFVDVTELLCGDLPIVLGAEVAGVVVCVGALLAERHDMVDHDSDRHDAFGLAHLAEIVRSSEPAVSLLYCGASPEAWCLVHVKKGRRNPVCLSG
jgi:hypothetical protein